MKVQKQVRWLSDANFVAGKSGALVIQGVEFEKDEEDRDNFTLYLSTIDGQAVRMSLWGDNLNSLIDKFGEDTDLWKGNIVNMEKTVSADGKSLRRIS
jgi:hypothetical protein